MTIEADAYRTALRSKLNEMLRGEVADEGCLDGLVGAVMSKVVISDAGQPLTSVKDARHSRATWKPDGCRPSCRRQETGADRHRHADGCARRDHGQSLENRQSHSPNHADKVRSRPGRPPST